MGVDELLAAFKLLDGNFKDLRQPEAVLHVLKRLWCKTETDEWNLERIWASLGLIDPPSPPLTSPV